MVIVQQVRGNIVKTSPQPCNSQKHRHTPRSTCNLRVAWTATAWATSVRVWWRVSRDLGAARLRRALPPLDAQFATLSLQWGPVADAADGDRCTTYCAGFTVAWMHQHVETPLLRVV